METETTALVPAAETALDRPAETAPQTIDLGLPLGINFGLDAYVGSPIEEIVGEYDAEWYLQGLKQFALAEATLKMAQFEVAAAQKAFENQYKPSLRKYVEERCRIAGGDSKTVKFDSGECSFRKIRGGLTITDAKLALAHAQAQGWTGVIKIVPATEELDTKGYRELAELELKDTGELIPGVENRPDREEFYAKPAVMEKKK